MSFILKFKKLSEQLPSMMCCSLSKSNIQRLTVCFWVSCRSVCFHWWEGLSCFWYWLLQRGQLSWPMRTGLWQHNYRQPLLGATICLGMATSRPTVGNRRREEGRIGTWGWVWRCLNPPGPNVLSCPRLLGPLHELLKVGAGAWFGPAGGSGRSEFSWCRQK